MTMSVGHSEAADRVTLEVEFDHHHRLAAHDPTVVTRFNRHNVRSLVLHNSAVGLFDVNLTTDEEADVGVHT
jgi:hypothetical protein